MWGSVQERQMDRARGAVVGGVQVARGTSAGPSSPPSDSSPVRGTCPHPMPRRAVVDAAWCTALAIACVGMPTASSSLVDASTSCEAGGQRLRARRDRARSACAAARADAVVLLDKSLYAPSRT